VIGTRRTLFRLWIWLLAATVIALAAAVVAIDLGRRDANALRTGLAPAREGVAAARESLVAADTEALIQFDALACDCAKLNQKVTAGANRQQVEQQKDSLMSAGPGDVFWSVFTTAGGQLAQVSQADLGGPAVEGVQVVTGLLNRYTGLIEQAFRNDPTSMLSRAYMQYAHNFLRNEVLSQLDKLRNDVDQAAPRRPPWGRHLLWALPLAALIALLAWAQLWLSRRFRRTLSVPLLAATVLAVAFGAIGILSLDVDRGVSKGTDTLGDLRTAYEARGNAADSAACAALYRISRGWPGGAEGCTTDSGELEECPARPTTEPQRPITDRELLTMASFVGTEARTATTSAGRSMAAVVVAGLLIGSLITLGFLPRIEEYRFRRR
jgi:hypothetical protein